MEECIRSFGNGREECAGEPLAVSSKSVLATGRVMESISNEVVGVFMRLSIGQRPNEIVSHNSCVLLIFFGGPVEKLTVKTKWPARA